MLVNHPHYFRITNTSNLLLVDISKHTNRSKCVSYQWQDTKPYNISVCSQYISSIYLDSLNNRTLAIRPSKLLPHVRHFATLFWKHLLGRCKGTCHEIHDQHVNTELFPKCLHTATPGNNLYLKHTNAYTTQYIYETNHFIMENCTNSLQTLTFNIPYLHIKRDL